MYLGKTGIVQGGKGATATKKTTEASKAPDPEPQWNRTWPLTQGQQRALEYQSRGQL